MVVAQNNVKEMYRKSVLHVQSCFSPLSGVAFTAQHYTILYFVYKQILSRALLLALANYINLYIIFIGGG